MKSPITGKEMSLVKTPSKLIFKGKEYDYIHYSYLCEFSKEQFTDTSLDILNIGQVYYKRYEENWMKENPPFSGPYTNVCLSKEEFIERLKLDDNFRQEWS